MRITARLLAQIELTLYRLVGVEMSCRQAL